MVGVPRLPLAVIIAVDAVATGADPVDAIKALCSVCPRGERGRALRDDEISLLRIVIVWRLRQNVHRAASPAALFALVDSGARPSEATTIAPVHLNDALAPTSVNLPGVAGQVNGRTITLDPFGAKVLASVIPGHLASPAGAHTTPIVYAGRHQAGGGQASASASGILARLLADAGLRHPVARQPGQAGRGHSQPGPQPLALTRWRVEHTHRTQGIRAALDLSGLKSVRAVGELVRSVIAVDPQPIPVGGFLAD